MHEGYSSVVVCMSVHLLVHYLLRKQVSISLTLAFYDFIIWFLSRHQSAKTQCWKCRYIQPYEVRTCV